MNPTNQPRLTPRDIDLKRDVLAEIEAKADRRLGSECIAISVRQGLVRLTGRTAGSYAEDEIESAVRGIPGVRSVVSEITIDGEAEARDACLAATIRRTLRRNRLLVGSAITPSVDDGWVRLNGQVASTYQTIAALAATRHVPGVRGITSRIRARDAAALPDDGTVGTPLSPALLSVTIAALPG